MTVARGLLMIVAGLAMAGLGWYVAFRTSVLFPDNVRRFGTGALAAIATGFILLGAQSLFARDASR